MVEDGPAPLLSVVIPCLNEERTLGKQLEALCRQETDFSWEVLVADNGSTDRTVEIARSFAERLPGLHVVHEPRRGRHHACNAGAAAARGELLLFIDADDEVAPGFLQAMAEALEHASVAAARIDHRRLRDELTAKEGYGALQTGAIETASGFLPFAAGACMGVRRQAFEQVEGFDEMPFCEDADISWKLQLAGHEIVFVPDAVLHYRQRSGLRGMYRQHRNYGAGQALLYRKYRRHGMRRRSFHVVLADWRMILLGALRARSPEERARWTRRTGRAIGRLRGSIKYRVLYP
jgi:glycosyltransferase involved in cell wall biosynthesis